MGDAIVNRKLPRSPLLLEGDLRGQDRARIAHRDQKFCLWKSLQNLWDETAIGWRFFHPAHDRLELNPKNPRIRLHQQYQQIFVCIIRVKRGGFEVFAKLLCRKMAVIRFLPLWRSTEKDADQGFVG